MSEYAVRLRILELTAELVARRKLSEDKRVVVTFRVLQGMECTVIETKLEALKQALADLEAAR